MINNPVVEGLESPFCSVIVETWLNYQQKTKKISLNWRETKTQFKMLRQNEEEKTVKIREKNIS